MNCHNVRPLLAGYVDAEVNHAERVLIEQHLAECQNCSWEVSQLRVARHRVQRELKSWAASTFPPSNAWEQFLARLAAENDTSKVSTPSHFAWMTALSKFWDAISGGRMVLTALIAVGIAVGVILTSRTPPFPHDTNDNTDNTHTVLIDDLSGDYFDRLSEPITRTELVRRFGTAYLLKNLPDGFRLKIVAPRPTARYNYFRINYRNAANDYFLIQSLDQPTGHVGLKFETYRTANGLKIYFMVDRSSDQPAYQTNAVVELPGGGNFLVFSNLSRKDVKTWVEDLVPAKS